MGRDPEHIGTIRQPLVGGSVVESDTQEEFGLLILSTPDLFGTPRPVCSASLLRNGWVITAAHCIEIKDAQDQPIPDPVRPGQNQILAAGNVDLTANWAWEGAQPGVLTQTQPAIRIETFRPYDIAIIQVAAPFWVNDSTSAFRRNVFQDNQFPYFGSEDEVPIMMFGRGISAFAHGEGASATPTISDNRYRIGYAKTTRLDNFRYWHQSGSGDYIAGGDSGGPSLTWVLSGYVLMGVHELASVHYLAGQPETWRWVAEVLEAGDAPVRPVWNQIWNIMGPLPLEPDPFDDGNTQTGPDGVFDETYPTLDQASMARFRYAADLATRNGFVGAFPNFVGSHRGRDHVQSMVFLTSESAEWRDVPIGELGGVSLDDFGGQIRAANKYASENGFVGGFPTFHYFDHGNGMVCGIVLVNSRGAKFRDVPISDLGNPSLDDVRLRFQVSQAYATRNGFAGGFPTMFHGEGQAVDWTTGDISTPTVCGTILLNSPDTITIHNTPVYYAQRRDVLMAIDPA